MDLRGKLKTVEGCDEAMDQMLVSVLRTLFIKTYMGMVQWVWRTRFTINIMRNPQISLHSLNFFFYSFINFLLSTCYVGAQSKTSTGETKMNQTGKKN